MADEIAGKVALVTGAATGIGAAVCRALAARGASVAVCDVNDADGQALALEIGGRYLHCDVSSLDSVGQAVEKCRSLLGVPDYAHLNAGIMTVPTGDPYVALEDVTEAQYRRILGVNLDGVFHGLKTLLPLMRGAGRGITMTASTAGLGPVAVDPLYTASKHALIGLGRAVAAANTDAGIRINVICPGVTDTGIVPDDFRKPQYGLMPVEMMATEIVDLLLHGDNGEVRVKHAADKPAFAIPVPELG